MAEPDPKRLKMSTSTSQTEGTTFNFDKGESVVLKVGPKKLEMLVHVNFISRDSEFFQIALEKKWCKGQTRTIALPEDNHETMTNYINFVYTKSLPTSHLLGQGCKDGATLSYLSLVDLYVLGVKLLNKSIKNAILKEIIRISATVCPGIDIVNDLYEGTHEGDPARRLMVDTYVNNARATWITPAPNGTFLLELSQRLLGKDLPSHRYVPVRSADYLV
jgi:hypothetical protein